MLPRSLAGMMARLPVWMLAALAAGCTTDSRRDGLSPHEFAKVDQIAIYMAGEQPPLEYQLLERIQGLSCNLSRVPRQHPAHKVVTEYEALYDMKLEAADLGANAIVGVSCQKHRLYRRCYSSILCDGDAVRLDDAVGMDLPPGAASGLQAKAANADFAGNPALYESLIGFTPDYLTEAQRAGLGQTGIAVPGRSPRKTVQAPPSGDEALYQGAGLWFAQCASQGGPIGLIVSPLCAAFGAGVGAMSAESEQQVKASSFAIRGVLEEYYSHAALRDRMLRAAARAGATSLVMQAPPLPQDRTSRRGHPWRFDQHVDSVIEIGVEELLLPAWRSGATTNLPSPVSVRARVRVLRLEDSREIYNRSYSFVSDKKLFRQWGADDGAALRHALEIGFEQIAERIVDDLLLVYPLVPAFEFARPDTEQKHYVVEPVSPPVHTYSYAGSAYPSPLASLQPTFRWQHFPSEPVLAADFQRRLRRLSELRYDLRIYRLDEENRTATMVLEKYNIDATEFHLTQALAPNTEYAWSVRARFVLDAGKRTTRWSGDWVGGPIRGFLIRTPG